MAILATVYALLGALCMVLTVWHFFQYAISHLNICTLYLHKPYLQYVCFIYRLQNRQMQPGPD